jgi:hypothetical protein
MLCLRIWGIPQLGRCRELAGTSIPGSYHRTCLRSKWPIGLHFSLLRYSCGSFYSVLLTTSIHYARRDSQPEPNRRGMKDGPCVPAMDIAGLRLYKSAHISRPTTLAAHRPPHVSSKGSQSPRVACNISTSTQRRGSIDIVLALVA